MLVLRSNAKIMQALTLDTNVTGFQRKKLSGSCVTKGGGLPLAARLEGDEFRSDFV